MRGAYRIFAVAAVVGLASPVIAGQVVLQTRMGDPLPGLTLAQLERFDSGKLQFNRVFQASEGLGPVMNKDACASCHNNPIGGSGTITVTRFGYYDDKNDIFDPLESLGGSLRQALGISLECQEVVPPEANVIAQRVTPSALGFGLLEAIEDGEIQFLADNPPPGVSGRVHIVQPLEGGPTRVGRFGWKAQVATVLTFSGDAALNEMGITNALVGTENAPNGNQQLLMQCDTVADPEDVPDAEGVTFIERITDFQRFLAAPPQTPRSGMTGEMIFEMIGCADCHRSSFTTPDNMGLEDAIRNKTVRPYTDFLLHDMGALGDGIVQGDAGRLEFRTTPLSGIRVRDPLVHDGRLAGGSFASRALGAIALHGVAGSEAMNAAQEFASLTQAQKDAVVAFLDSLGRAEFDLDGDNDIDAADLHLLADCYSGPGTFYTPDDHCSIADPDQDGDVDDDDVALFLTVYTGPQGDCNGNAVEDALDVLTGTSKDCNFNGAPDECDPESNNAALFVSQLLSTSPNPVFVCMLDGTDDGVLNGDDIAPWVARVIGP